ncbi:Invasion associated locus B family protein [Methylobacterium sp. 4-46]|uniref:invasion associated locus B family protein n=1 Tax=Methylobacterium sp. (strain 4-46) TaxID=426117 RepID=UPI000165CD51|nr:invasion associated locus B family protein [Methylobacterium sp. 4-46]ACA19154.1 Invasion associated locus B family protein [Methylobacterium sp. 4-46]
MPSCRPFRLALTLALALGAGRALGQEGEAPAAPEPAPAPAPAHAPAKPARRPSPAHRPAPPPAAPAPAAAPSAAPAGWPPGASAVSEVYGDWTVSCSREGEARTCQVSQAQGDSQTGRRRFSIELRQPQNGRSEGVVLVPLGLQVEPGITFKLDDATLGKGAPFTTCVTAGCIAPISFPTVATDAMRTAVALRVTGMKQNGEAETFTVPLSGFAAAFARMAALSG